MIPMPPENITTLENSERLNGQSVLFAMYDLSWGQNLKPTLIQLGVRVALASPVLKIVIRKCSEASYDFIVIDSRNANEFIPQLREQGIEASFIIYTTDTEDQLKRQGINVPEGVVIVQKGFGLDLIDAMIAMEL